MSEAAELAAINPVQNPNVTKAVNDMNAGWRNEVVNRMGMDSKTFQLAQGTLGLQTTDSSGLFHMADSVPPESAVFYDASGNAKRSDAYAMFLNALLPPNSSGLRGALGPMYEQWVTFKKTNFTKYTTLLDMFDAFAMGMLDTNQTKAGRAVIVGVANNPLVKAQTALNDPAYQMTFTDETNHNYSLPKYTATHTIAVNAINSGSSASINFDTSTMSTQSKGTTVSGSASGFFDIFSGGVGSSFNQLNQKAASSGFEIKGTINKYATVPTIAGHWYNGAEVGKGYNGKNDNTVWDPNSTSGDWNNFFNSDTGTLARRVSQLLLVSDYDISVTSKASYSQSELTQIQANATFGIWPFFSTTVSTTHTSKYTLNKDATLTVHHKLNKGLIQIWGVNIQDAPN